MILAAGFGTRLQPLTNELPKALVKVKGKPMISHVIDKIISAGIENIVINVHHMADKMVSFMTGQSFDANIQIVEEDIILGTGGGIKNAAPYLKSSGNFLVHNVDVLSDLSIVQIWERHLLNDALATLAVQKRSTSRPLLFDDIMHLCGRTIDGRTNIVSKRNAGYHEFAFNGIHIISDRIFELFPAEKFFDIIPVYLHAVSEGEHVKGFDMKSIYWHDLGKSDDPIFTS